MQIPLSVLSMLPLAWDNKGRYCLDGIHVRRIASQETCVAVATNGWTMIVASWPESSAAIPGDTVPDLAPISHLIDRSIIEGVDRQAEHPRDGNMILVERQLPCTVVEMGWVTWSKEPDGDATKYPDVLTGDFWGNLKEPGQRHIMVRPELLHQAAAAIKELTRKAASDEIEEPARVVLTFPQTPSEPLLLTALGPDGRKVAAAIMPVASPDAESKWEPKPAWDPADLSRKESRGAAGQ